MTNLDPEAFAAANPLPSGGTRQTGYTGVSEGFMPKGNVPGGTRYVATSPRRVERVETQPSSVSGVVSPQGNVLPFYELNTAPGEILGSLDDIQRNRLTNLLYTRGWYGNDKPQGGFGDNDRQAMKGLLYYSNVRGRTWDEVLNTIEKAPFTTGGGGAAPSYSSKEDLAVIADKTALSTIGRKLTPEERQKFVASYQGVQRADRAGGEQAPSADVFFQNRIEGQYGAETDAYKYLTAISNVAKLLENI